MPTNKYAHNEKGAVMAEGFNLNQKSTDLLNQLDLYIKNNFDQLTDRVSDCISQFGESIYQMQQGGKKGAVAYLQFSMLRTNILRNRHELRLDAYDDTWYMDMAECSGSFKVDEVLSPLTKFSAMVEALWKEASTSMTLRETQSRIFEESQKYLIFLAELIRLGMQKAVETEGYRKFAKAPVFVVCIGGLLDRVDILYKEDTTVKDGKEIRRYLKSGERRLFSHEIYEQLDLSKGSYAGLKFLYSSFAGSDVTGSSFHESQLLFDDFRGCILKDTDMTGTQMFDVNFSQAQLENVSFAGAKLNQVSFQGAELSNVDFDGALLMEEVDFTDAVLNDTKIPDKIPKGR